VSLPTPEPGLVIRHAYLRLSEHRAGREEGVKDRPCAIVLTARDDNDFTRVLVVPVTHNPPGNLAQALELPAPVEQHLSIDAERSWIVLSESNLFVSPDPALCRVGDRDNNSIDYGFLPTFFFVKLQRKFFNLQPAARSPRVQLAQ
jgi:hypothetical protein